ncbi:MAG: serine/threonine protein kinase [Prevotella sp.]|nr:serine/threonine protein kinase [Prevotella sp.]
MASKTVITKPDDPNLYLIVKGREYKYNPDVKPLGGGAMGTVYLGYDCKSGEKVAVKRVKDQYSNYKQVRERAKLEASLAFHHPNLVEMVGYCEYAPDKGPIFILSRYVKGVNIKTYVKQNLANADDRVERICQMIFQVLDALSYIHSKRFIHRDIKPSNIMASSEDNVKLMDLGIARMNGGNKFSTVGFIGTPQYSAPEQILRGDEEEEMQMGPSTDLYALGITLYELITGDNPYKSNNEVETLTRQIQKKLPVSKDIPWALMKVLRKATAKEPANRYQSADEMKVALKDALAQGETLIDKVRIVLPFLFK